MNTLTMPNTAFIERNASWVKLALLVSFFGIMLFFTGNAHADIFASGKAEITAATDSNSTLYMVITVISLAVALITGITTKNWFGAIGGFMASMIFLKVGMAMVGLS
ncbi:hypothetical protein [Vibrio sp. OPT18]|uniref:hypothetical protein n=1 Tax=Vibrio sp. OPT18 TaxID=2778641 RepID=UPI001882B20B|nr:hypothetical protein [Vibrio sp. OPT18]MBE8574089.1 hypothetical protein [Vibrio sp. OPT18]